LDNITVHEVQVHPLKERSIYYTKEFIINLEKPEPTLTTEIRLEALQKGVHGYIKKIETNQYRVIAAGRNEAVMKDFKALFSNENEVFNVSSVDEFDWNFSVNTGFVIKKETVKDLAEKLTEEENKLKKLSTELENIQKKLEFEKDEKHQKQKELSTLNNQMNQLKKEYNSLNDDYIATTLKLGETERA